MSTVDQRVGCSKVSIRALNGRAVKNNCIEHERLAWDWLESHHVRASATLARTRRLLTFVLVAIFSVVAAQTSTSLSLPSATETSTQDELLQIMKRIDTSLGEVTEGRDSNQLRELKSQLEQLLLQAELETLRHENVMLREQLEGKLQGQNLQGLPSTPPKRAGQTSTQQGTAAALPPEVSKLQRQFALLSKQQDIVNAQLKTIANQHAMLLDNLGSAALDTKTPSPSAQRTHVVRPGDSLSQLANTYYGIGARWPEIVKANPSLTDSNRLLAGTVLVIP